MWWCLSVHLSLCRLYIKDTCPEPSEDAPVVLHQQTWSPSSEIQIPEYVVKYLSSD